MSTTPLSLINIYVLITKVDLQSLEYDMLLAHHKIKEGSHDIPQF